ncbi:hypothetical protein GCM10022240_29830 [Microbacterium kribbense]|uniref:Uncharacterized protein n=2 Tax=Microbacterium kribbense TaxID=433645 RepID=A0ABP7GX71_9MICO
MVSAQLAGEDFMVGLDRRRADTAGQMLEPMPTPPSTAWAGNAKRFTETHPAGIPREMKTINTAMGVPVAGGPTRRAAAGGHDRRGRH